MEDQSNKHICQYCNKTFCSVSSFNHHQKTAKSCLKIQEVYDKNLFQCCYCDQKFSTKYNLEQHQKTSKTCYKLSLCKNSNNSRELISFICTYCEKSFTQKNYLDKHYNSCLFLKFKVELEENFLNEKKRIDAYYLEEAKKNDEKFKNEKESYQDEIKSLNKQLDNGRLELATISTKLKEIEKQLDKQENINKHLQDRLLEKATTKTNNTTNNNIDLKLFISEEVVNQKIQSKFNKTHLIHGYNGIANFIKSEIVTNEEGKLLYTCSDPSRQIFNYIDEKGNEVKDIKGTKMISLVKPKLIEKTCQIQAKEQNEYNYLCNRYNGDDEKADEDVQRRIDQHKFYSDIAADMLVNKIGDTKFPSKMSSELAKVLT